MAFQQNPWKKAFQFIFKMNGPSGQFWLLESALNVGYGLILDNIISILSQKWLNLCKACFLVVINEVVPSTFTELG